MSASILHGGTATAAAAATTQPEQLDAIEAAFAGDITVRAMAGAVVAEVCTYGPWVRDSLEPRGMTLGALSACTVNVTDATITSFVFIEGSTPIFSIPAADASLDSPTTKTGRRTSLADAVLTKHRIIADASLPLGAAPTYLLTFALADVATVGVAISGSITNTGTGACAWSITPPAHVTVTPSSGTLAAGGTQSLSVLIDTAGTYDLTLVSSGTTITGAAQNVVASEPSSANPTPFRNTRTGTRYATLALAVAGSISGDTVTMSAGTYVISSLGYNDPGMTWTEYGINLETFTLEWETPGVMPVIDLSAYAYYKATHGGRAVGIEAGPNNRTLTVRGLHLIGSQADASGGGDNAAYGINSLQGYLEGVGHNGDPPSVLNVEFCKLEKWGDGVKNTYYNYNLTTNVRYTLIEDCTANDKTHGMYVNGDVLNVLGCTIRTTVAGRAQLPQFVGHLVKSRTKTTTVRGSLLDAAGGCAACIDVPNGGTLVVDGSILLHYGQVSNSDENPIIKFGAEQRLVGGYPAWDDRVHDIKVAQNTFRKDQPSWSGSPSTIWPALSVSTSMTLEDGTPLPPEDIPRVVRNNIAAGPCGASLVTSYPDNTGVETSILVPRATISDIGVYSGTPISGDPLVNDAAYAWAGEFTEPLARTDTYRGGRVESGWPAWRVAITANTWGEVGTSLLADVNPAIPALGLNPNGLTFAPWKGTDGHAALINAWTSTVWDEATKTIWIPMGGGHGNYAGNETYKKVLSADSPVWELVIPPSGAIGWGDATDGSWYTASTVGVYPDGRPRSPHTYNGMAFADGVGPVLVRQGSPYPGGGTGGGTDTHLVFRIDPVAQETELVFDFADAPSVGLPSGFPGGTGPGSAPNSAACYDPTRNRLYSVGSSTSGCYVSYCTPSATPGPWSGGNIGTYYSALRETMIYVVERDLLVLPHNNPLVVMLMNPEDAADRVTITPSGSPPTGFVLGENPGFVWCSSLGQFLVWNQTSNNAVVGTLTPNGDWTALTWGAITPASGSTPYNRANGGCAGLMRYSASLGGFYLITDVSERTLFFATE